MAINQKEIARRRTFAIISHPDAGKTTLTEKLLLYGGAVQLAGSVTARKQQRATTSDWMELERKRGISISSTVLQFDYNGYRVNLLDTPGHKDFSEDTYRVLTAVDSAVMVVDAGKGIESQTRKLFEVCRRRGVPIFTFVNKLDRPSRDPLATLDEIESVLGIGAYPVNWPLGTGQDFKGVYDRVRKQVHLFERMGHGAFRAPVEVTGLSDPAVGEHLDQHVYETALAEIEMLDGAGVTFDIQQVLAGKMTPVFFGSAMNNFGVQLLLDDYLRMSPGPGPRRSLQGPVSPEHEKFSAFVFKMQSNMDPKHRDIIAFARIVSGKFTREMSVFHSREGKRIRLSDAHRVFARERETVDEAYPGDVIGLIGGAEYRVGDTLSDERGLVFDEMPRFTPEVFATLENPVTANFKKFRRGLEQLLDEGVVQPFEMGLGQIKTLLLGAVGPLQFDIVQYRLQAEYGAESHLHPSRYERIRWVIMPEGRAAEDLMLPSGAALGFDVDKHLIAVFSDQWEERSFTANNPGVQLLNVPPAIAARHARAEEIIGNVAL